MTLLNSSVGLIYAIKADSSDAQKEVSELRKLIDDETGAIEESGNNAFLSFGKAVGFSDDQIVGLGKSLPVLGSIVGGVAVGLAAAAAAAVSVGVTLFDLTKKAAEAGTEIQRFSTLTGFSAQTVSALKAAAEAAGTSIDEIEEVFESFVELMIEAGQGAEDAALKVKSLGLDPQTAFKDLEGSFLKVLDKIREMPTQAGKAKIAMDGMGESGLNMIKVADEMTGGTAAYIAKLKEMGLTMDEQGIRKAKEYDRQLKETDAQISGIGRTIGMEFMPIFLDASKSVSAWLKENKGDIKNWATDSSNFLRGIAAYWDDLKRKAQEYRDWVKKMGDEGWLGPKTPDNLPLVGSPMPRGLAPQIIERGKASAGAEGQIGADNTNSDFLTDLKKQKEEADKAAKERAEMAKRDAAANVQLLKNQLEQAESLLTQTLQNLYEKLKETGDTASYTEKYTEALVAFKNAINPILKDLQDQEIKAAEVAKQTSAEMSVLYDEQSKRQAEYQQKVADYEKTAETIVKESAEKQAKSVEESVKTRIALYQKNTEAGISSSQRLFEQQLRNEKEHIEAVQKFKINAILFEEKELRKLEETKETARRLEEIKAEKILLLNENEKQWREYYDKLLKLEIEKRGNVLEIEQRISEEKERQQRALDIAPRPGYDANGNETTKAPEDETGGVTGGIVDEMESSLGRATVFLEDFKNITQQIGGTIASVFMQMGQAVGQMVGNWVLMGKQADISMRKMVASVLSGVAAQSITLAGFHTAMGIAALTPWGAAIYGNPILHFKAAALWGAIGVGTALLGRVAAGNEFQNQASGNAAASGSGGSSGGNSNGATAYSSFGNNVTTVENDLNRSSETTSRIKIELDQGLIARVIREDANNNGPIRQTLISVQQGI